MSRIYWDSMLFIYMLESHPAFGPKVRSILADMIRRGDTLCTSVFSIGEVLTGPRRRGSYSGADRVKRYFLSGDVDVLPFTIDTADAFSMVRATTTVRPPDAVHLATASVAQVDLFLTNDNKLISVRIPGIKFVAGLDGRVLGGLAP